MDFPAATRRFAVGGLPLVAAMLALLAPATAAARTITVGSSLNNSYTTGVTFLGPSATFANLTLSDPAANPASPVDGVVLRWRLVAQSAADAYALHVMHPTGGGFYEGTATSAARFASTAATETFATKLPIKAGDLIAIDGLKDSPTTRAASISSVKELFWNPIVIDGLPPRAPSSVTGLEFGFNAEVQPAPEVTLVSPSSGSVSGGTEVTIAGADFTDVEAVEFGSAPAASYTVDSENQITAKAPAVVNPGPLDVAVTTIAGTSPAVVNDRFTYNANPSASPPPSQPAAPSPTCVVPKLKGKNLKAGRRALAKTNCKLGKVTGRRTKAARVVKQSPKAGTVTSAGSAVNVSLARRSIR